MKTPKINTLGKIGIAIFLLLAWQFWQNHQTMQKQAAETRIQEERAAQFQARFQANKAEILADARQFMADKAWWAALDATSPFKDVPDPELQDLRAEAEEQLLYGKIKNLPASDIQGNLDGYARLARRVRIPGKEQPGRLSPRAALVHHPRRPGHQCGTARRL